MKKNKGGRPVTVYTPERLEEIRLLIEAYIEETEIPILAEFAYKNDIPREILYRHEELSHAIKKLMNKKETELERLGLKTNNTMAIFSLKQLGWKDKTEMAVSFNKEEAKKELEEMFYK